MKRGSTIILRAIIGIIAGGVLFVSLLTLSMLLRNQVGEYAPILIGVYVSLVPFFFALYQMLKLLGFIDKNKAFTQGAVMALRNIKYSAIVFGALYTLGMPYIYLAADHDDAPGVIVLGLIFAGGAFVLAVFAAVAQRLFQNAVDIKSENDLTV